MVVAQTEIRHLSFGFWQNVLRSPKQSALRVGGSEYTYERAAEIAWAWAALLLERFSDNGQKSAPRVGLLAYRSEESYLGVLAALLAGAAFVPLNPKGPPERLRAMVEQADLDAIIVDENSLACLDVLLGQLSEAPRSILAPNVDARLMRGRVPDRVCVLGRQDVRYRGLASAASVCSKADPQQTAYLLFTSGTTGLPKGVPITHDNARAFLDVNLDRYKLTRDDRLTQTFDQTFDLSIFDLFMAWESGACVCSMQPLELLAPAAFLRKNEISVWFSVPSVAALLMKRRALEPRSFPTLRWSLFCGEGLPRAVAEAWQAAAPYSVVENLYGPTELTIACSAHRWRPECSPAECAHDLVPIGEIYPGLHHLIIDAALNEVADGEAGELCVGGRQVFPGYWRAPALDAARFIERASKDGVMRRFYRTGDRVHRVNGQYVYLGRGDQQTKIGGYRIELGEIEAALRRSGCIEAVALAWPKDAPNSIVAVVSGADMASDLPAALDQLLPAYMIPSALHVLDKMPLNANGKVDRKIISEWLSNREYMWEVKEVARM